jgi:predicted RNA methylase
MQRRLPALVTLLMAGLLLAPAVAPSQDAAKKVTLKVLLPERTATVTVNGVDVPGEGDTRAVKVAASVSVARVEATWDPNGYTKITRPRTVALKGAKETVVDLRKADAREKDDIVVIYVPTPDDVVEAMCKLGRVTKEDVVYDLGCGDGRMVITAVKKFGARRGVGVDIDAERVADSKENARKAGVEDRVEFRQGDVLKVEDLKDATVVLLYMGDDINQRLRPILQKTLKPGSRIVSHRFLMGDWKAERTLSVESKEGYTCQIHLWEIKGAKD